MISSWIQYEILFLMILFWILRGRCGDEIPAQLLERALSNACVIQEINYDHTGTSMQVTTPLLKLLDELVQNKSQRLIFDSSSPNGILLFREVSKLIVAYGSRISHLPIREDAYTFKYKGVSICLSILTRGMIILC